MEIFEKYNSKYSYLTKVLSNYNDIEELKDTEIEHFFTIYEKHKNEIKKYHINYSQHQSFNSLYSLFKKITNEKDITEYFDISKYEIVDGWHIIESTSFDMTKNFGSNEWCISKSKNDWNEYNYGKNHYILINSENKDIKMGLSFNIESNDIFIFNEQNKEVSYSDLACKYPTIIKRLNLDRINQINQAYTKVSFLYLLGLSASFFMLNINLSADYMNAWIGWLGLSMSVIGAGLYYIVNGKELSVLSLIMAVLTFVTTITLLTSNQNIDQFWMKMVALGDLVLVAIIMFSVIKELIRKVKLIIK